MLLQRLVEFAEASDDNVPEFYARKPVRWALDIKSDGAFQALRELADASDSERRNGVSFLVPSVTRTSGVSPVLAVDNVEYVFGWVSEGARPDRVAKQHEAFRELHRRWADAESNGPASAIAAFYQRGENQKVHLPEKWSRGDLVAFCVDGVFAFQTEAARRYWAKIADVRKGSGRSGLCLVCGKVRSLLKTIPQQIPRRWLPGATQSASLVSVNEAVHGYELQKFLVNTPICSDCGLKFMSALSELLSNERHSFSYPGQNTRLVWWVIGSSTFDLRKVLDRPDEGQIRELLATPIKGERIDDEDLSTFCSLTVSGNVARVVVRDWIEMPLPVVMDHIREWIRDHEIIDVWTGKVRPVALTQLTRVTGRWKSGRGSERGSWAKFGAPGEDRPDGVFHALLGAALFHRPLPPKLLTHVINRIRADKRVDSARAALIRLALRRYPLLSHVERERLTPALNVDNTNAAYVSGRIFAVLDDLQRTVYHAAQQSLNTTFADRYLARAITNPRAVLVTGRRYATAWLRRLRGPLKKPGWAMTYMKQLDDLFGQISVDSIPSTAVLAQKANFILGYHHQRAAIWAERRSAAANKRIDVPPAFDDELPEFEGEEA